MRGGYVALHVALVGLVHNPMRQPSEYGCRSVVKNPLNYNPFFCDPDIAGRTRRASSQAVVKISNAVDLWNVQEFDEK